MGADISGDVERSEAEQFVELFVTGFGLGGGYRPFVEFFLPHVADDVVLTQPFARTAHGHEGFSRSFETLFGVLPDLTVTVSRWGPTRDGVLIEFVASGTLGGRRRMDLPTVDRFTLRDGRIARRDSYINPWPPLKPILLWSLGHPVAAASALTRLAGTSPAEPERGSR